MKPINNYIIIKGDTLENKMNASGLAVPDKLDHFPDEGVVTHVHNDMPIVKVGDKVIFNKYKATQFDEVFYYIKEEDVVAIRD